MSSAGFTKVAPAATAVASNASTSSREWTLWANVTPEKPVPSTTLSIKTANNSTPSIYPLSIRQPSQKPASPPKTSKTSNIQTPSPKKLLTTNNPTPHPKIPYGLSTPQWALSVFKEYGPQSSVYQTRVLGDFPEQANDTLIPLRDVEAAVKRTTEINHDEIPFMGVDIARFGDDKTVIIVRRGSKVVHIEELRKSDLAETTGVVLNFAKEHKVRNINVDEVGVGAGVLDNLKQDRRFNAKGINGGMRADNPEKYLNLRAQLFDGLRQRFADGDISIPNDPELISQLASITYKYNARGQLHLESKDVIRSHGRQSPDKADALAYAFADTARTRRQSGAKVFTPVTLARLRRAKMWDPRWRD